MGAAGQRGHLGPTRAAGSAPAPTVRPAPHCAVPTGWARQGPWVPGSPMQGAGEPRGAGGPQQRATPSGACTCRVSGSLRHPAPPAGPTGEGPSVERPGFGTGEGRLRLRGGHADTDADTGAMQPQARGHLGPPGTGRGRQDPPGACGGRVALPTPDPGRPAAEPGERDVCGVPPVCRAPRPRGLPHPCTASPPTPGADPAAGSVPAGPGSRVSAVPPESTGRLSTSYSRSRERAAARKG